MISQPPISIKAFCIIVAKHAGNGVMGMGHGEDLPGWDGGLAEMGPSTLPIAVCQVTLAAKGVDVNTVGVADYRGETLADVPEIAGSQAVDGGAGAETAGIILESGR